VAQVFAIRIEGPDGTLARAQVFHNLGKVRAEWLPDIWKAVGEYTRQVVMARQFDSQGAHVGGQGWAALSSRYLSWKNRHGYDSRIGHRTGAMRQAITGKSTRPSSRSLKHRSGSVKATPILNYSADGVTVGGSADEGKGDYSQYFNLKRKIFGTENLNSRDEAELGKMLTIPFVAASRTKELGTPETDEKVSSEQAKFIANARLRRIAS